MDLRPNKTILVLRIVFMLLAIGSSFLVCYSIRDWDKYRWLAVFIGACIGALVILVDMLLKGFSLRGLSALTFGIFIGWLLASFIERSPLFEYGDPQTLFIVRLATFVILMYLGSVIALRGKDEFNFIIPYLRFVPHGVDVPLAILDSSALIDGRIVGICSSRFLGYGLVIPRFIIDELHRIADSPDPVRQARGRKGLEVLNKLRKIDHIDLRIQEVDLERGQKVEPGLVALAQTLRAKVLTTDYNLAQVAQFHNLEWLNINALTKALAPDLIIGEQFEVELVQPGKEPGQAVGYLSDGSKVVVNEGRRWLNFRVLAEVQTIFPTTGGKMIFARVIQTIGEPGAETQPVK